jgi:hypothetical protein
MHRINNFNNTYTHPEANKWLQEFMVDLKKTVLIEADYQPFTMERLDEWATHLRDLESCFDYESTMMKRLYDNPVYEHSDAIACFNGLVIDLKLKLIGHELRVIDEHRIAEAEKYFAEIHGCKKQPMIFY